MRHPELTNLVEGLAKEVQGKRGWKRKLGSTKVVLSKQPLKTLQGRLTTAIDILGLYRLHYTR